MISPLHAHKKRTQSAGSVAVRACVCVRVFTSSTPAHEAQVVEAGHLVLHHGRGVPQLGRVVLVVPGHHRHQGPVGHIPKSHHLQGGVGVGGGAGGDFGSPSHMHAHRRRARNRIRIR